jgi:enoyl-CoA hydratase/carnithine racemase
MNYGTVLVEQIGSAAILRMNRPERLNAYTPEMGEDLASAFRQAAAERAVRAIILTGAGRGFCAGADRDCLAGARGPSGLAIGEEEFVRTFALELAAIPKLTIAAFNGPAAGIGVTMTLSLDIRIAAAGVLLKLNFASLGIMPGLGSTSLLPRLIGMGQAKKLLLCDQQISAERAAELGLIEDVVAADQLLPRALALAEAAAKCAPEAIAAIKAALGEAASLPMPEIFANEALRATELNRRLRGS